METAWTRVVGRHFADTLDEKVLVIGREAWTKTELAEKIGIVNVQAARRLSRIVKRFKVQNLNDLYHRVGPEQFIRTEAGVATMYVLLRTFEAANLDAMDWYAHDLDKVKTFSSLKQRKPKKG